MSLNKGINFYKMEGTGNDFVILNKKISLSTEQIKLICNRHYGIGCDQLIVLESLGFNKQSNTTHTCINKDQFHNSQESNTTKIKIFNNDGSDAFSCGNGIRCVALLMKILYAKDELKVQVIGGNLTFTRVKKMYNKISGLVYVELGDYKVIDTDDGSIVEIGNKHLIIELDKIAHCDMAYARHLSKKLDLNVSFIELYTSKVIALTYERGASLTNACGSAAAAIHIAIKNKKETEILFKNSGEKVLAGGKDKAYIVADAKLVFSGKFFYRKR